MRKNNLVKGIKLTAIAVALLVMVNCKKEEVKPTECPTPVVVVPEPTSVTDIDGNVYPVLKICGKLWMTENLRTTRYNDGAVIPTGLTDPSWSATTSGAYSVYNSTVVTNTTAFGKLYNWFAASSGKLAPNGWHVATEAEWIALVNCLGGTSVAGGKMKSTSSLWNAPNTGADNSSGFSALPGGYRSNSGLYALIGNSCYFWGSDERNSTQGEYIVLDNNFASAAFNGATKQFGYAIRCVKD